LDELERISDIFWISYKLAVRLMILL
jgi:hypothetical protein